MYAQYGKKEQTNSSVACDFYVEREGEIVRNKDEKIIV